MNPLLIIILTGKGVEYISPLNIEYKVSAEKCPKWYSYNQVPRMRTPSMRTPSSIQSMALQ